MHNFLLILLLITEVHPLGFLINDKLEKLYMDTYLKPEVIVTPAEIKYNKTAEKTDASTPIFPSKSYYSIDLETNQTLLEKNIDEKLPIASLTKLMTAYIVLKEVPLDKKVTINTNYMRAEDATAGLQNGEVFVASEVLQATLINSASEAAISLAIAHSGSPGAFAKKMNETATTLQLADTHFSNPVGWDEAGNYSSAKDIASLTRILLRNDDFNKIIDKKTLSIKSNGNREVLLENTNQLLGINGFSGVKTGFTYTAGECLVSLNKNKEREILTVVIGSGNRFGETNEIINWIYTHYLW